MPTNLAVCIGVPISHLLTVGLMLIYHRVLNVKVKPEEGPCRGLFCDCEIFGNLCMTSVSSSGLYDCMMYEKIQSAPNSPHCRVRRGCIKQGSGHNGLVTGGLSWSWSAAGSWSVASPASPASSLSLSPSGELGGDVSAGSPGSPGHSGGHLRLGAYTGLHTQEVGWSLIEQTQLYV